MQKHGSDSLVLPVIYLQKYSRRILMENLSTYGRVVSAITKDDLSHYTTRMN